MTPTRALTLVVLAAVLCLAAPGARAQSDQAAEAKTNAKTIAKVVELNKEAIAQYQHRRFDGARKVLREALDLCESAGLARHPVAARTHIHLGIVIIAGFGQREIGARQFGEALQIQPDITLTPGLATPAVQDAFNEVAVAVTGTATATPTPPPPDDQTPAPQQEDEPARAPTAEISDDGGASAGPADDEVPRTERRAPATRSAARDDEDDSGAAVSLRSRVQIAALVGGGVGWTSGMGDVNADTPVPSAFAAAKLGHLALEGGYWFSDELMLSLQGRFQVVSGPTLVEAPNGHTYHPATGATAIFAAGTWSPSTAWMSGHLRPYLSAAVGGGRIRHVVTIPSLHDCGTTRNQPCVDTVGAGPFLAGVDGGLMYDLGEHLALVAALNTQLGAPTFTFNVDLNVGVAFRI